VLNSDKSNNFKEAVMKINSKIAKLAAVATVGLVGFGASTPARADSVQDTIAKWSADAQKTAMGAVKSYGTPDEVTNSMLIWHNKGPWKRIIASKLVVMHKFPGPHPDSLEGVIDYKVPADKVDDLARFDGSVIVDRTRGELSARCDADHHNVLALNLAHDIVSGKRGVENARAFYTRAVKLEKTNKGIHAYALKFNFPTHRANTEYPDVMTLKMMK